MDEILDLLEDTPASSPSRSQGSGNVPSIRSHFPPSSMARTIVGRGGVRRTRLKCLTQRHKLIIGLHLQGFSGKKVAEVIGCSVSMVTSVVNDPLAQEVIAHYYEGVESELKALLPQAVDAVRKALDAPRIEDKLKGVDRFAKLSGIGEGGKGTSVTVNVIQSARERFVMEVKAASERRESAMVLEGGGRGGEVVDVSD